MARTNRLRYAYLSYPNVLIRPTDQCFDVSHSLRGRLEVKASKPIRFTLGRYNWIYFSNQSTKKDVYIALPRAYCWSGAGSIVLCGPVSDSTSPGDGHLSGDETWRYSSPSWCHSNSGCRGDNGCRVASGESVSVSGESLSATSCRAAAVWPYVISTLSIIRTCSECNVKHRWPGRGVNHICLTDDDVLSPVATCRACQFVGIVGGKSYLPLIHSTVHNSDWRIFISTSILQSSLRQGYLSQCCPIIAKCLGHNAAFRSHTTYMSCCILRLTWAIQIK